MIAYLDLIGDIDLESTRDFFRQIHESEMMGADAAWVVNICSPGGAGDYGVAIYEELKSRSIWGGGGHCVTTIATGQCGSIATLIFQAGDVRVSGRFTIWTFHRARVGCGMDKPIDIAAHDIKQAQLWDDELDIELIRRSNMEFEDFRSHMKDGRDWDLTAHQVLEYGFVDEVR